MTENREQDELVPSQQRVVIIGGVAAGAAAAARYRRLNEAAEIVILEKGGYVSFANCGLPYHLSDVIPERSDLLLKSPEDLWNTARIDVRVRHEAVAIEPAQREVSVVDHENGAAYTLAYDHLVIATGASAIVPDLPGIERAFTLRSIEDLDLMKGAVAQSRTAVVVGGGFIGLEVAENLVKQGLAVTVLERAPQILSAVDADTARIVVDHLRRSGVAVHTGSELTEVTDREVVTDAGDVIPADLVVMAVGVAPRAQLARAAGLAIGLSGAIVVDASMRTSDPHIWAAGDVVEQPIGLAGPGLVVPLANLAARQGRLAADSMAGRQVGRNSAQSTAIVSVFGLAVATTGLTTRQIERLGLDVETVHLHPWSHVTYFPGAARLTIKAHFDRSSHRLVGAQVVGESGVDKRIDVLAVAIKAALTARDLVDLELAYAPQFGAAKDPINLLGYVADNRLRGDAPAIACADVRAAVESGAYLIDVREPSEFATGHLPGAINIPLSTVRERVAQFRGEDVVVYCQVGQRAHNAQQIMIQSGVRAVTIDGGLETARWCAREITFAFP